MLIYLTCAHLFTSTVHVLTRERLCIEAARENAVNLSVYKHWLGIIRRLVDNARVESGIVRHAVRDRLDETLRSSQCTRENAISISDLRVISIETPGWNTRSHVAVMQTAESARVRPNETQMTASNP